MFGGLCIWLTLCLEVMLHLEHFSPDKTKQHRIAIILCNCPGLSATVSRLQRVSRIGSKN